MKKLIDPHSGATIIPILAVALAVYLTLEWLCQ